MTRIFRHDPIDFSAMPPAIKGLLIANIIGFAIAKLAGPAMINDMFGLVPQHLIFERWIWQPVTYLFIHGNIWHLIFNLFALWMFGMPVEAQWGEKEFLKYYFLCGFGAALTSTLLNIHSTIPVIGASGPIYGLLVAFAMLYPDAVVYLYFLIPVKAAHMAILFGALEFFAGATGATPGIARFAHLGGMVTGYFYIRWWWVWKLNAKGFAKGLFHRDVEEAPVRPQARRSSKATAVMEERREDPMAEVDRILDKILASGLESLTDAERELMKRYSDRNKPS
ncbi:MAG TPA: rhomboid family intramembrane serine protease [Elusimicrobiota bacterium]|nr:rhomboid family intramembrane serine protease [Elusimicrobiota bacterium]